MFIFTYSMYRRRKDHVNPRLARFQSRTSAINSGCCMASGKTHSHKSSTVVLAPIYRSSDLMACPVACAARYHIVSWYGRVSRNLCSKLSLSLSLSLSAEHSAWG